MARIILNPAAVHHNYHKKDQEIRKQLKPHGLEPEYTPWLRFRGEHHFDHMIWGGNLKFPNGEYKTGTIRINPDNHNKPLVPISEELLVFESDEWRAGAKPRGVLRFEYVAICPLEELTDKEVARDGFNSRDDMIWQMTEMEGRYYQDLTPQTVVSYFAFGGLNPSNDNSPPIEGRAAIALTRSGHIDELRGQDKTGWLRDFLRRKY